MKSATILGFLCVWVVSVTARAESPYWDDYGSYSYGSSRKSSGGGVISLDLDPQNNLNSSFRIAARENRFADLQRLLAEGAEVNSRSDGGLTALMYASRNCSVKGVGLLLQHGAEINARDFNGRTALIFAAMDSCEKAAEILLKSQGIDLDASDGAGKTALDYASDSSVPEVGGPSEKIMQLIRSAKRKSHSKQYTSGRS